MQRMADASNQDLGSSHGNREQSPLLKHVLILSGMSLARCSRIEYAADLHGNVSIGVVPVPRKSG